MIVPRTQSSASSDQTNPGPQPGLADMLMAAAIQAKFAKRMGGQENLPVPYSDAKTLKDFESDMEVNLAGTGKKKMRVEGPGEDLEPHAQYQLKKGDQDI